MQLQCRRCKFLVEWCDHEHRVRSVKCCSGCNQPKVSASVLVMMRCLSAVCGGKLKFFNICKSKCLTLYGQSDGLVSIGCSLLSYSQRMNELLSHSLFGSKSMPCMLPFGNLDWISASGRYAKLCITANTCLWVEPANLKVRVRS